MIILLTYGMNLKTLDYLFRTVLFSKEPNNMLNINITPSIFHWLVGVYEPLFSLFGIVIIFGF
ncbi:hypothetical protein BK008_06740 [Methanobacterium sp. MZ-A1]|nr:hypothetical protein BK008_06740 [Methanobacterium sp. MZ-A1]